MSIVTIPVKFKTSGQKVAALRIQGDAFAASGGVAMMLTEFVENGNDAIKEKHRDGNKKLDEEIVDIEIDEKSREIRIIDSGTGITNPIHMSQNVFDSLKSDQQDTTGQFGRGLQTFRGFCTTLEFITLREVYHQEEKDYLQSSPTEPATCIKLTSTKDSDETQYVPIHKSDFQKYQNFQTGTVAILKGWSNVEFQRVLKAQKCIKDRLQHHFGFELATGKHNISISLKVGKSKIEKIAPRSYPEDYCKHLYDLPSIELNEPNGTSHGSIDFKIFKTTLKYKHPFKEPFILVNDRPLADYTISSMPELQDISDAWKSNYITGYVKCDKLKTNQLRTGIDNGTGKSLFVDAIINITDNLINQINDWSNIVSQAVDKGMTDEVATEVQRLLKKSKIKFNFKNLTQRGESGSSKDDVDNGNSRISDKSGNGNDGKIDPYAADSDSIKFHKLSSTISVTVTPKDNNKSNNPKSQNGDNAKDVSVNRALVSKDGRKARRVGTGPDIKYENLIIDQEMISKYEAMPPTVFINREHNDWKKITKITNTKTHSDEKRRYVKERYLWELVQNCSLVDEDQKDNLFWKLYHEMTGVK